MEFPHENSIAHTITFNIVHLQEKLIMIALQKTFKPDFGVFSQKSSHFDISSVKVAFQFSSSDPLTLTH